MPKHNILSGQELVAKGFTKIEATLPEVGLKDVQPNGSWLEQKQIQSALESRKHLIEIERIEKSGALSVAIWNQNKMLAEVTQKVGGYWQFMGHNIGSQLFLYPEEALYLMEVNCLQLIHNDIKVSLQQAYSLLLKGKVTIIQYKVFASLSRLGYRLFRHEKCQLTDYEKKIKLNTETIPNSYEKKVEIHNKEDKVVTKIVNEYSDSQMQIDNIQTNVEEVPDSGEPFQNHENVVCESIQNTSDTEVSQPTKENLTKYNNSLYYQRKVEKIKRIKLRPCQNQVIHKCLDSMPSLLEEKNVTIKISGTEYIPKTINLKKNVYNINLENIKKKRTSHTSSDSSVYSASDEANGSHIRRLDNSTGYSQLNTVLLPSPRVAFTTQNMQFRLFNIWGPQQNFNLLFQRPFLPRRFAPNFNQQLPFPLNTQFRFYFNNQNYPGNQFFNFNNPNHLSSNVNYNRNRKKRGNAKSHHLEGIKRLASRLKQLAISGNANNAFVQSLQRLIHTYNIRYKTKVKLTNDFDIIIEQNIIDTIELEDDSEPQSKRRRTEDVDENFEQNLNLMKQLAAELKDIDSKGELTPKHRRAFAKVLASFNDTYNVEYYINNEFLVLHRQIIIASSSDSDCHIEQVHSQNVSGKKLKNPFNIIKRLSETHEQIPKSPTYTNTNGNNVINKDAQYSKQIMEQFSNDWLPPQDDFGRAEVVKKSDVIDNLTDNKHEEFLYDFFTVQQNKFKNWFDLKLAFFNSLEMAVKEFQNISSNYKIKNDFPGKSEDYTDMDSVLRNLRIIKAADTTNGKSSLKIDFDVFNRNVQNFKKSKPPIPHFRLICLDESSTVPSGEDVAALNAEYRDNVGVVFAIVGAASVSYVQINSTELPVYVSNNTKM